MYVIGLAGPAGVGKSTTAAIIEMTYGFQRMSFATPLRRLLWKLLTPEQQVHCRLHRDKVTPWAEPLVLNDSHCTTICDMFRDVIDIGQLVPIPSPPLRTEREALQFIGTDICRAVFGDDCWVKAFTADLPGTPVQRIVIDDVRFPSECKWIWEQRGVVMGLLPKDPVPATHISENALVDTLLDMYLICSHNYPRLENAERIYHEALELLVTNHTMEIPYSSWFCMARAATELEWAVDCAQAMFEYLSEHGPKTIAEIAAALGYAKDETYAVRAIAMRLVILHRVVVLDGSPERLTVTEQSKWFHVISTIHWKFPTHR